MNYIKLIVSWKIKLFRKTVISESSANLQIRLIELSSAY